MPRSTVTALAFAVAAALVLQGCQTQGANLTQKWRAECEKAGNFGFSGNVAECVARRQAAFEAESLSGVADL